MEKRMLGLYIHIPFCVRKCRYCDFLSAPASEETRSAYLKSLEEQIRAFGRKLQANDSEIAYLVDSIFIGGGTPSLLSADQMQSLLDTVRLSFCLAKDCEITAECNPGTVTSEKLLAYQSAGINRLSIGLQSSNNEELALLGRIHSWEEFLVTFESARKAGFSNLNIDVMGALPGQTPDSYQKTLERVLALHPEHISAYSLIIEEGTPFFEEYGDEDACRLCDSSSSKVQGENAPRGKKHLPSEDEVVQMDELTWKLLSDAGYEHYEISNYALPGKECRHNLKYWHCDEYLGVGTGAASYIRKDCGLIDPLESLSKVSTEQVETSKKQSAGSESANAGSFIRLKVLTDTSEFSKLDWNEPSTLCNCFADCEELTRAEEMEEMAFLGLRTKEGVRLLDFYERFGKHFDEVYGDVIKRYTQMGMMRADETHVALTIKGMEVANWIMADFCE